MKTSAMKTNNKVLLAGLLACLLGNTVGAAPLVFDESNMSTVGNVNNAANANGYGAVKYEYQIGTYEVTNAQYAAFLNAVAKSDPNNLYHTGMGSDALGGITRSGTDGAYTYTVKSGSANRPVNYVSIMDAYRFVNWLTNGQGTGSTETGSYDMSLDFGSINRMTLGTGTPQYYVTSENEWFKAAYYDPTLNDGAGGYWQYGTKSNIIPTPSGISDLPNRANIAGFNGGLAPVGSYVASSSYYGLFDTEGNLSEFMDTINGEGRVRRGSWYSTTTDGQVGSGYRGIIGENDASRTLGFRITMAVVPVPEPAATSLIGAVAVIVGIWGYRKRLNRAVEKGKVQ